MDYNDPRNPNRIPEGDLPRGFTNQELRHEVEGGMSMLWPVLAIGALLVAGMLFFTGPTDKQSTTQVGQNVERPVTPNTTPKTTSPQ